MIEPTGSIQTPQDLIDEYNKEAGATTTTTSTATGITDKAGVTDQVWKPTDVDAVKPSVTDPAAAPETGIGAQDSTDSATTGKDTLWRGVDAYKDSASTGPSSTGISTAKPTSGESTTEGPKGAVDAEPKNYSIGDLTTGEDTPAKPVGESTGAANTTSQSDSKTGESAISPPDLSTTSPGEKPDFSADTHEPSPKSRSTWTQKVGDILNNADGVAGLVGERAGHGGPTSAQTGEHEEKKSTAIPASEEKKSSISPSADDDEKSGKMDKLKDKLKTKLHIGSKDH